MTIQNKYRDELYLRNSTFAIDSDSSHQSFANFKFRATIYYKSDVTKTSDLKAGSQAEFKTFNSTYGQMPVPVFTGYVFIGWYTQPESGTQVKPTTTVSVDGPNYLYAHWKKVVKVSYDVNGGTGLSYTTDYAYAGDPYGCWCHNSKSGCKC